MEYDDSEVPKGAKHRPKETPILQQRLRAWQPILSPQWIIVVLFLMGCAFLPIGIIIINASEGVTEIVQRYDDICSDLPSCNFNVSVSSPMDPPIYFYYQLTDFYQNQRDYVSSRSDPQLHGSPGTISGCTYITTSTNGSVIVPCGLVANSFFNDTMNASLCAAANASWSCEPLVPFSSNWSSDNIIWPSDTAKFIFQPLSSGETREAYLGGEVLPPVNDPDLINWMRSAPLPTFRKLYRIINDISLPGGSLLNVQVNNLFPVSSFSGTKSVVLSTTSILGGQNAFLGWAYVVVATLSLGLGILFQIKQSVAPRQLGDMNYFTWAGQVQFPDDLARTDFAQQ